MTRKKGIAIFLSFIIFLNASILFHNSIKSIFKLQEKKFQIQFSYESSLAYGEYVYFYTSAGEGDKFRWEFSGTNSYVGITVFALTDTEFSKFQNLQTYYYYSLSNGSYYIDSGHFIPPSYDTWYIVFRNIDSDIQITYLTYNVVVDRGDDSLFEQIFITIISTIIIGGIIAGAVVYSKKQKKKRKAEIVSEIKSGPKSSESRLSKMEYDLKYCSQCGTPQKMNAIYCVKCGNKFNI